MLWILYSLIVVKVKYSIAWGGAAAPVWLLDKGMRAVSPSKKTTRSNADPPSVCICGSSQVYQLLPDLPS